MAQKWDKQDLIDLILVDLINGEARSQILMKIENGLYSDDEHLIEYQKGLKRAARYKLVKNALDACKEELKDKREEQKGLMYSRYLSLYNDCVNQSDNGVAKSVLDSLVKLMGLNEPEQIDVNGNFDVVIDFNLNLNKDKDEDDLEEDE